MTDHRKIDALVAEHITGFTPMLLDYGVAYDIPHYSTDISAAWQVWEHLHASGKFCCMDIRAPISEGWEVVLRKLNLDEPDRHDAVEVMRIATAPLAISLCALKARGVEV